ncbi:MAG: FAD:protein FMN transferase, partial [Pedococcus sp.]
MNTQTSRVAQHAFTASASFDAIGTHHHLIVTRPETLGAAITIARDHLVDLDAAVSRFRSDSEVSVLARRRGRDGASTPVSAVFAASLAAALRAARLTDGLVDPTVGAALIASGYDADLDEVRARSTRHHLLGNHLLGNHLLGDYHLLGNHHSHRGSTAVPGWRTVELDEGLRRVRVPAGTVLDLG